MDSFSWQQDACRWELTKTSPSKHPAEHLDFSSFESCMQHVILHAVFARIHDAAMAHGDTDWRCAATYNMCRWRCQASRRGGSCLMCATRTSARCAARCRPSTPSPRPSTSMSAERPRCCAYHCSRHLARPYTWIFFIPWGLQSVQDPYEAPIGGTVCPAILIILPEYEWLC